MSYKQLITQHTSDINPTCNLETFQEIQAKLSVEKLVPYDYSSILYISIIDHGRADLYTLHDAPSLPSITLLCPNPYALA